MKMSGATLAWQFFHPKVEIPPLFRYVEDKDIWRWALVNSNEFSSVFELCSGLPAPGVVFDQDFKAMSDLYHGGDASLAELIKSGTIVTQYQNSVVKSHAKKYTRSPRSHQTLISNLNLKPQSQTSTGISGVA